MFGFAGNRKVEGGLCQGRKLCIVPSPHHCRNLIERLQVSDDLGLMGRFDAGEASRPFDGFSLGLQREVVELAARVGLPSHVLVLAEDANSSADGNGCSLVVPRDHDDTYPSLFAEFHRADHLLPGRVQHSHAANKRETQLIVNQTK